MPFLCMAIDRDNDHGECVANSRWRVNKEPALFDHVASEAAMIGAYHQRVRLPIIHGRVVHPIAKQNS